MSALRIGFACAVLLSAVAVAVPGAAAGATSVHTAAAAATAGGSSQTVTGPSATSVANDEVPTDDRAIVLAYEFAETEAPDRVRVRVELATIPDGVTSFRFTRDVPGMTVESTKGFDREDGDLVWDGRSYDAELVYTAPAAPGSDGGDDCGADERSRDGLGTADAADWTYVGTRAVTLRYAYRYYGSDPGVETRVGSRDGVAGSTIVFLGEAETIRRGAGTVAGSLRFVVPRAANLSHRESVVRTLVGARNVLAVGALDDRVNVFVTTAPIREGGVAFPQRVPDEQDVWVRDDVPVETPENVWIHEYVHTRQAFEAGPGMAWFAEASADYYAALLTLRQSRIPWSAFRDQLRVDERADDRLTDPGAWTDDRTPYTKGRRVLAALDVRIRDASGGEASLQDVFRRMNRHDGPVAYDDFRRFANAAAGEDLSPWLDRYVRGPDLPPRPREPYALSPPGTDDADYDGLSTAEEREFGTSPFHRDTDEDGLADAAETDRASDPTVADTDGDGLVDGAEVDADTAPVVPDTDGDGLSDGAEVEFDADPLAPDTDGDGLSDGTEAEFGADPTVADTDGDDLPDDREYVLGSDPRAAHSDGDGLDDAREAELGTDPTRDDTDGDGLPDDDELEAGTAPTAVDGDGDGLPDPREADRETDPTDPDTDGDGYDDGAEVRAGTDPMAPTGRIAFFFANLF